MFRIGLSVYLMVATLAGPWLCCCRMPRLSARFVALLRDDPAKPAGGHHSCCQHRVPVKDKQPMRDSQPANHPNVPSCPCQGTGPKAPSLVLLESDVARQLERNLNDQAVALPVCDSLSGVVMPSADLLRTPSVLSSARTGRDILSSLHILRC